VLNEDYSAWFALRLGKKDLELAVSMAEYFGKDLAVAKFVQSYYQAAFDEGLADEDIVSVIKLFRK
jgi:3-hydroxyisobutyrate dehydrogenase-like beta-hydroxyacid dehydrogenase